MLQRSEGNFAHVTTALLSLGVQNFLVIDRICYEQEHCKLSPNFELEQNIVSGTRPDRHTSPWWLQISTHQTGSKTSTNIPLWRRWHTYMYWLYISCPVTASHVDVITWKHFPRYWAFVWGIHRSPVNSPHKGPWRRALTFSLICPNKQWRKQSRGSWFEMPLCSLWRYCNVNKYCLGEVGKWATLWTPFYYMV